jgi:hypothetical protein
MGNLFAAQRTAAVEKGRESGHCVVASLPGVFFEIVQRWIRTRDRSTPLLDP